MDTDTLPPPRRPVGLVGALARLRRLVAYVAVVVTLYGGAYAGLRATDLLELRRGRIVACGPFGSKTTTYFDGSGSAYGVLGTAFMPCLALEAAWRNR